MLVPPIARSCENSSCQQRQDDPGLDLSLEELAELADKTMDVAALSGSVSAVHPPQPPPQLCTEVDQLRAEVTRLQTLVKFLQHRSRTPSRRPTILVAPLPIQPRPHAQSRALLVPPQVWRLCQEV